MRRFLTVAGLVAGIVVATGGSASAITGGTLSDRAAYPYFVEVSATDMCGGSVVADSWVLTAAHCVYTVVNRPELALVRMHGRGYRAAEQVIVHPLFDNDPAHGHDLAVLRLPAGATAGIAPVRAGHPLDPGAFTAGTPVTIMGTGNYSHTQWDGQFRAADVVLRSDDDMDDLWNPVFGRDYWVSQLMIGAGGSVRTGCHGDSGAPVAILERHGRVFQVGVFSTGEECSIAGMYMELFGPQLAWLGSVVPGVRSPAGWGACTTGGGSAGEWRSSYSLQLDLQAQRDGAYYWRMYCQVGPTVPVPLPPAPPLPPEPEEDPGPLPPICQRKPWTPGC